MLLPIVLIQVRLFDSLVFGPSILKPDLDLSLWELELVGQLATPASTDVFWALILDLQAQRLLRTEGGALAARPALFTPPSRHCNKKIVGFFAKTSAANNSDCCLSRIYNFTRARVRTMAGLMFRFPCGDFHTSLGDDFPQARFPMLVSCWTLLSSCDCLGEGNCKPFGWPDFAPIDFGCPLPVANLFGVSIWHPGVPCEPQSVTLINAHLNHLGPNRV